MRAPSRGCYRPVFWKRIKKKGAHYTTATRGASVARALLNAFDWGGKPKPGDPQFRTDRRESTVKPKGCVLTSFIVFSFFPSVFFPCYQSAKFFAYIYFSKKQIINQASRITPVLPTPVITSIIFIVITVICDCVLIVFIILIWCVFDRRGFPPPSLWFDWITYRKEVSLFHHRHIISAKFEEYSFWVNRNFYRVLLILEERHHHYHHISKLVSIFKIKNWWNKAPRVFPQFPSFILFDGRHLFHFRWRVGVRKTNHFSFEN